ncbi:MAG TPA: SUMF1/EgtB/PvdO family nonheme iron enzyme [Pirellulales bacterium]|nr:SUMF1/EgtB/PvdO family nonheme iron enzyme [Pirellulales bacterium]
MIHATRNKAFHALFTIQGPLVLVGVLASAGAAAADKPSHRWALLIGIDDYQTAKDLSFCGADQRALAAQLVDNGFERERVFLLDDAAKESQFHPFKANIEKQLDLLVNTLVKQGDVLIVGFSGHGVLVKNTTYLCPTEGNLDDPATLISLSAVCKKLERSPATLKLVLVDACRRNARPDEDRGPGDDPKELATALAKIEPPPGLLLLNSCSEGEVAKEDGDLKHGVFMHFLLEGLRGAADADRNRHVSLRELTDYTADKTELYVARKFIGSQQPFLHGNLKASGLNYDLFALASASTPQPIARPDAAPKPNSLRMKFKLVPAGEFLMGSDESVADIEQAFGGLPDWLMPEWIEAERPRHQVRITRAFELGIHEVRKIDFSRFVEATDYKTDAEKDGKGGWGWAGKKDWFKQRADFNWRSWGVTQADTTPVVNVSWNDAMAFCKWLGEQEGCAYRLPSEAEWEYACRAGTTPRFSCGDAPARLPSVGNVADLAFSDFFKTNGVTATDEKFLLQKSDGHPFMTTVGRFRPNAFGIYDMHGNAAEWCADWYGANYYENAPTDDPQGPAAGSFRVIRGGGWYYAPVRCRSAYRNFDGPADRLYYIGFRVVRAR